MSDTRNCPSCRFFHVNECKECEVCARCHNSTNPYPCYEPYKYDYR